MSSSGSAEIRSGAVRAPSDQNWDSSSDNAARGYTARSFPARPAKASQRARRSSQPIARRAQLRFDGPGDRQQIFLGICAADELETDGHAGGVEADGECDRGEAEIAGDAGVAQRE